MSGAVLNVVCGFKLDEYFKYALQAYDRENLDSNLTNMGFESFYSANGETPYYFGERIAKLREGEDIPTADFVARFFTDLPFFEKILTSLEEIRASVEEFCNDPDFGALLDEKKSDQDPDDFFSKKKIMAGIPERPTTMLIWSNS